MWAEQAGQCSQGPGPSGMPVLPPKRSGDPSNAIQGRGFTPGHKPPEAFCHLPGMQRAREAALLALGRNRHETWTLLSAQPYHHCSHPRSSLRSHCLSLAALPSASVRGLSLVFSKVPVSTSCMPLGKVTHHCSHRSLWMWGLMGLKMLRVNIGLIWVLTF